VASARLSRKAALGAIAVLAVILGVVIANVSRESPKKGGEEAAAKKDLEPALNAAKSLTKDIPDVEADPRPAPRAAAPTLERSPGAPPAKSSEDDARLADTAVPKFSKEESTSMQPAVAGWSAQSPSQGDTPPNTNTNAGTEFGAGLTGPGGGGAGGALRRIGNFAGVAGGVGDGEPDLNRQDEKLAFQRTPRRSAYLTSRLTAPVSPYELKTGTVIPGLLIGAMNSDLPGEIIAQVSQNVYDTASGNYLLIPQGTRLYGHYDSNVSFGQGRLLVSWDRLIFPNAYALDLQGMTGHDQGGAVGYGDRVNHHYGRMFGAALLTSVLSAGFQLSQPQQSNLLTAPGNGQIAAAAVGQQMTGLGIQIAQRNLQVQPTIEIRKGYRMNVMVSRDIVFPGTYAP
jgi:type IV secretion system protein VirB10